MEAVTLDTLLRITSRDRQQLGDPLHVAVKRRVKAGHLRPCRMTLADRLDQFDLAR